MALFLHNPIVAGAISGLLAAAVVDFHAFKSWHSFQDARAYDWGVALFRWFQGTVIGALGALGLGAL